MPNLKNQRGQGLVEYILILVVMAILSIGVIQHLATSTQKGFTKAQTELDKAFGS